MAAQSPGKGRQAVLGGIMAVLVVVAVVIWATYKRPSKPKPEPTSGAIYYTGPMEQKGNPNMVADEDGKIYPPAAKGSAETKPAPGTAVAKKGATNE